MYGYTSTIEFIETIKNANCGLYQGPYQWQKFIEIMENDAFVYGFIARAITKSGTPIWISENAHKVCDAQGNLLYYEGTIQDISVQKKTEEILQRQLLAFQIANEGISILTAGKFIYVNPAYVQLFGYTSHELMGKPLRLLYAPEEIERMEQEIFPSLDTHRYWQGEVTAKRRDGSLFVEELSLTLADNGDWVCISRDISERKRMQARLEQSRHDAEVANRTKSQFLATMSHELRTPLNAIYGFGQVLNQDPSLSSEHRDYAEIITQSSTHLLNLINDILDMSKIEAGLVTLVKQQFDLHQLLDMIMAMFKLKVDNQAVCLSLELQNVPKYVIADDHKLRQVLINLVGNAVKFTTAGCIRVQVAATGGTTPDVPIQLWFTVSDSGPGISEAEQHQLFQPFVQTETGRKSQQGTGLGLSISQKFVALMGGQLTVKSTLGQGTCFTFSIQAHMGQPGCLGLLNPTPTGAMQPTVSSAATPLQASEILTVMSPTWIAALDRAARSGDDEKIHDLVTQIPADQARLIEKLTELADHFAFETILNLVKVAPIVQ
jgi:PAS domain S-box-containing protein